MDRARHPIRSALRRALPLLAGAMLAATTVVGAPVARVTPPDQARAAGTFADPFFREYTVFSGLVNPVSVRFAADGRAFVAEKAGVVKAFDSITDTTATTVIDLRTDVNSYWDRGLLGIAIDPDFLGSRPYLYLYYVYDAPAGQTAPVWNDVCPSAPDGPGGTADGCPVTSKLDRITIDRSTNTYVPGTRKELLHDWCQQFPSHSGGGLAFGPDGQLYLSGGDGASFTITDYGQRGGTIPTPSSPYVEVNPCGDPVTVTSAPGDTPTVDVATSEGGSLRSQDLRTTGDPVGLDGTLIRVDPDTGAASAGNPLAAEADANARRIVAHGFRNPFRLVFRPGTSDLYVGDVGNQTWEEIERVAIPTTTRTPTTMPNFGWPCYEGPGKSTWQAFNFNMCNALYAAGSGAVATPLYAYSHVNTKSPTGPCFVPDVNGKMGSATTGLAFYEGATGQTVEYPATYAGALFFVDYSRNCLGALPAGPGGIPDGSAAIEVASGLGHPVDLLTGPGGDLYYVNMDGGKVVRIRYVIAPNAQATATPNDAKAPVTVHLDGSASTDPDPNFVLTAWRWDLNDDGAYDDATGATYDWSITTPGVYRVGLQVESSSGLTDTVHITVDASNAPPVPVIDTPSPSLTWSVGDQISFSGHATDPEDGTIPAADLSWDVVMMHCPADCHEHLVQTFTGVASGSFPAPDHEYPSHLELRLSATDSHGVTRRTSIELLPKTATINVASSPTGVPISVGSDPVVSPSSTTIISGGSVSVSPPTVTTIGGKRYRFSTWNDTQARVRDVTATGTVSLLATYVPDASDSCSSATPAPSSGTWTADHTSGNGDVDWFRFTLSSKRRVVVTLGNLGVDARLDLYSSCSTHIASSNGSGTRFEEITRLLAAGTYRVRVSVPSNAWSGTPYYLRFRPMASGLVIKSATTTYGSGGDGPVRIVGEVLNNSGRTRGMVAVKATFRTKAGAAVATRTGYGFAFRIGNGSVTPFVITGTVPAYSKVTFSVTAGSVPAARSLSVSSVKLVKNGNGTVTESGSVRNRGTTTARSVGVARTWYGTLGQVLDRGTSSTSPSTLGAGRSGTFVIVRPANPAIRATRTEVRGR
jgi:glucose/arabinose dehydrogenase